MVVQVHFAFNLDLEHFFLQLVHLQILLLEVLFVALPLVRFVPELLLERVCIVLLNLEAFV